jgi:hypothetical protein
MNVQAQSDQILENSTVIEMVESGLPGSIIIKKIQDSPNRFDLSTDALVDLATNEVPEDIITAMMEASENTVSDSYELVGYFEEPGIYILNGTDLANDLIQMQPTVIDKVKEGSFGNTMAKSMTSAVKTKVKAIITSPSANFDSPTSQPEFYFYFGNNEDDVTANKKPAYDPNDPVAVMQALQGMSVAQRVELSNITSPNEMNLVRCDQSKKERIFVASKTGGMYNETGVDSDYIRNFRFEKLAKGLFRVYFDQPLGPGEYLFVYAGVALYQGQFVFDFTVL